MNKRQQRFIKLLEEIFEINKSDLDFGIYRILNIKRKEIEDFFRNRLPKLIENELAPFATAGNADITNRMAEIETQMGGKDVIATMPDSVPIVAEYRRLQAQLATGFDMAALESDVYSALYSFFNRYYEEGDFISKRRYKEGVYAIPYEGEEVKLYWANQDQYYIKTSENFKDYTFMADDITVHFRLVDATTEQNNNKESESDKRVFMLFTENEDYPCIKTFSFDPEKKEFIIRFTYDIPADKKKKYAEENYKAIVNHIASEHPELVSRLMANTSANPKEQRPLIQKHLEGYVAKNTFDYFIHKDLKGFLSRELDFYIKNEILHIDDIDSEDMDRNAVFFAKIRAIKKVARILIDFLAQLENFQKRLWLKKKFVVETNWCITLDNIDENFYPEIAANEAQTEDWVNLFAIDKIEADLQTPAFSRPLTVDFLKANTNLVLDTRHFSHTFRDKLIASIDNLDEKTDGVMLNSDNYQALGLLEAAYRESVDAIYVDPPYNTDSVPILYKNGYKDSSWLCLMEDRLLRGKKFLSEKGIQCTAIDDFENPNLNLLLKSIFGVAPYTVITKVKPSGRPIPNGFAISHDYGLFSKLNQSTTIARLSHSDEQIQRYRERDEKGPFFWEMLRKAGSHNTRQDRPTMYYPFFYNEASGEVRLPKLQYDKANEEYILMEECGSNEVVIYPKRDDGSDGCWYFGLDNVKPRVPELKAVKKDGVYFVYYRRRPNEGVQPLTTWDESKNSATEHGTGLLKKLFGDKNNFSYPKSLYTVIDSIKVSGVEPDSIILDYFAGSATTGHAVIALNREANTRMKYLLVEMGEYFETITKPRIEKVIYATDWSNGTPTNRTSGLSQIVKYMRLESYEDALSNVELRANVAALSFGDEYMIHYMLNVESQDSLLNTDKFTEPFNFAMKITEKNESKVRNIDVVETFNYLIGLAVSSKSTISIFNTEPATNPAYEGAVELRKDSNGTYMFQQLEGKLPDGRRALVIWRNITEDVLKSNAALDAYFQKYRINPRDREFDVIFVNGDNNIENLRLEDEQWKVVMTEKEFNTRMWEEA